MVGPNSRHRRVKIANSNDEFIDLEEIQETIAMLEPCSAFLVRLCFRWLGGPTVVVSAFLTAADAHSSSSSECPSISSIRIMPFHDEPGHDPTYDRLRFQDDCEDVLVSALSSNLRMNDPRQAPTVGTFTEADAAVFILLERYEIDVAEILPPEPAAEYRGSAGIYAYFSFVKEPEGRAYVANHLRQIVAWRHENKTDKLSR